MTEWSKIGFFALVGSGWVLAVGLSIAQTQQWLGRRGIPPLLGWPNGER